jgi:uncharacterized RDD family membrane protein YckC
MPDDTRATERVTFNRRFFGDYLLEGLLWVLTLGIGWFIWLAFTAQTAQTPAKRLLGVYVLDASTGLRASAGKIFVRDVLVKMILLALVGWVTVVGAWIDALWVFFDKNRQALHDKVVDTIVVYAPAGLPSQLPSVSYLPSAPAQIGAPPEPSMMDQLERLAALKEKGVLTQEEFESKKRTLLAH